MTDTITTEEKAEVQILKSRTSIFSSSYCFFLSYSSHLLPPGAPPSWHSVLLWMYDFFSPSLAQVPSFIPWISGKGRCSILLCFGLAPKAACHDVGRLNYEPSWNIVQREGRKYQEAEGWGHAINLITGYKEAWWTCLWFYLLANPWEFILESRPQQQTSLGSETNWSHTGYSIRI